MTRNPECASCRNGTRGQRHVTVKQIQTSWTAPIPSDKLVFDLATSRSAMTRWRRRACRCVVRTSKPRLSPTVPLHCLAPPIFEKPQAQPRHRRKDKTVKSYQSSGRRTKLNKSVPCSPRVKKALAMRKIGLPGQDYDAFHRGLCQAYDEGSSSPVRSSLNRGLYQTTKVLGVRLPRILSNNSGRKRGSVGATPDWLKSRSITTCAKGDLGAQRCAPDRRES